MISKPPQKPAVEVVISTSTDHDGRTYAHHKRTRPPTSEQEQITLKQQWQDLEWERARIQALRRELEIKWPPDVARPHIQTIEAIDWTEQPLVPAEKIDWSAQGEPLRVRPTVGAMLGLIALVASLLGAGAYFYWGVRLHIHNKSIHVPRDGVPWGVKSIFETRIEASRSRKKLRSDITESIRAAHNSLRHDVVKDLSSRPRGRRGYRRR